MCPTMVELNLYFLALQLQCTTNKKKKKLFYSHVHTGLQFHLALTQAPSRCCYPSLFSLCCDWVFLCVFIWVWWLWCWWRWWLILANVVVVNDFGSGFVDFDCGGGG